MDTRDKTPVVFRDEAERQAWWQMLLAVSVPDGPFFDDAVEWADDAIRAARNRSTPDVNVTPAEANDLYAAGYRQAADSWAKVLPNAGQGVLAAYNGLGKAWAKVSGDGRRTLRSATWDPSKQSLFNFLRECEAAS